MESPTSSASPLRAEKRAGGWLKTVLKVVAWLFAIVLVLLFIAGSGGGFLIEIPIRLAFGWIWFGKDNLEAITPNWLLIAEGIGCIIALGVGGHYFMRWLWAQVAPVPVAQWRARWTAAGLGGLLLLFVAGIATIGITHQTAWLFTAKGPMLVDAYTDRVRISEAILSGMEAREAVTDYFMNTGKLPDNGGQAGLKTSAVASRYVKSVTVGAKGVVDIELVDTIAGGGVIRLTPLVNGPELQWKCGGTLPPRYLPGSCRDPL